MKRCSSRRRSGDTAPLVRLGQGDYRRDILPHHLTRSMEGPDVTTPAKIALGFLIREPADVYHAKATNHLSSHWLAEFRRCPLLYHRKRLGLVPQRDSAAFLVGRAAHTLILEGRARYESEYAVGGPINPKTGNPYGSGTKAFAEWAEGIGKPVLSDDQAALVEQMAAAVTAHSFARVLLAEGLAEGVLRCRLHEHDCQARLDWINPDTQHGLVDLKTADNLDSFEFDIRSYGYVHQLAFYRAVLAEICGVVLPVHVIAVEKREPYRCGVWLIDSAVLDRAHDENAEAMRELAHCKRLGIWPTRFESLRTFDRL